MRPLWLPAGSVRSLIALSLVFASIASAIYWIFTDAQIPETIDKYVVALFALTATVVNSYFKDRAAAENGDDDA